MLIAIAAVSYIHVNNKEEVLKFSEMGGAEVTQNVGGWGGVVFEMVEGGFFSVGFE